MEGSIAKSTTIGQDVKDHPLERISVKDLFSVLVLTSMIQVNLMKEIILINS